MHYLGRLGQAGLIGIMISTIVSLIPYGVCNCGWGLGFPLANIYPHQGSNWIVKVHSKGEFTWFLDFQNVLINVLIWTALVLAFMALSRVGRKRSNPGTAT